MGCINCKISRTNKIIYHKINEPDDGLNNCLIDDQDEMWDLSKTNNLSLYQKYKIKKIKNKLKYHGNKIKNNKKSFDKI